MMYAYLSCVIVLLSFIQKFPEPSEDSAQLNGKVCPLGAVRLAVESELNLSVPVLLVQVVPARVGTCDELMVFLLFKFPYIRQ